MMLRHVALMKNCYIIKSLASSCIMWTFSDSATDLRLYIYALAFSSCLLHCFERFQTFCIAN